MRAVKRYIIKCIAHADKSKFKVWKEIENGDTYAGWSECPPANGHDFVIRFHHKYDVHNTVRIGRVVDVLRNTAFHVHDVPPLEFFKLNPKLSPLSPDWRQMVGEGDLLVQTENALLVVREVAQWQ